MLPPAEIFPREVDCLVLGGGITGAGVARDAAMRGHQVLLVESHDFASGTSHVTSKVVHGGLRYLEHGHVRPVIQGVVERDRLLTHLAPHLVRPLKFVIPFEGRHLPKWAVAVCGLQLYGLMEWYRGNRTSMPMLGVRLLRNYPTMQPHPFAVTFWDARTNDARLVLATLRTAEAEGAAMCNYTSVIDARLDGDAWNVTLRSRRHEQNWRVRAKSIVNATGPWSAITGELLGSAARELIGVKGTHLVLRRPAGFGDDAIVMRSVRDARPLWVIPWQNRLIVGTTESRYAGDLRDIHPTVDEVDDLFESYARFFPGSQVTRSDICSAYAGVRPIIGQKAESENSLSREHRVGVDEGRRIVSVSGGKLTTFRCMAEDAVGAVDRLLGLSPPDGEQLRRIRFAPLWPGVTGRHAKALRSTLAKRCDPAVVDPATFDHLVGLYGFEASLILEDIARDPRCGRALQPGLPYTLAELAYLCRRERVYHLSDLLKRRTPLYFLSDRNAMPYLSWVAERVAPLVAWNARRVEVEVASVRDEHRADTRALANEPLPSAVATTTAAIA